jgi:membrane protease YdiL (CAAX protease family)
VAQPGAVAAHDTGNGGEAGSPPSVRTPEGSGEDRGIGRSGRTSRRRTDWRLGGRTTSRWRERVLGVALLSLGFGLLGGHAITSFIGAGWAGLAATLLLWIAMAGPVVWALGRSRPVGLLQFRAQDLLFGIAFGVVLRTVQGWTDVATGGSGAFPSYPTIGGAPPQGWVFDWVIAPLVVAPVVEEFYFRAVVLVCVFTMLRRAFGALTAGLVAALVSAGLFVFVHGLVGALTTDEVISLSLLGLACSLLVLLTGRIWPAVLLHVVYNGSYVVLALTGTFLA